MKTIAMLDALALMKPPVSSPGGQGRPLLIATLVFVLLFAGPKESRAQVAAQDSLALVAFYNATGGPTWAFDSNANWLTGPVSSWHGVAVEDGRVTKVQLAGDESGGTNQINGSIPPELGQLTALTVLDLSINQLSGSIPPELGQLTALTVLDLSMNQLSGSIPPEMEQLTRLTDLNLNQNQLSGSIPPELGQLTNLVLLHLSRNQLTGPIPAAWSRLTNLTELFLDENQLTGSIPPELGRLTNLQGLSLSENQLTGAIPAELSRLTNLEALFLDENQLTGPIPPELGRLTNLVLLFLSGNQLTGPIPPELGRLTKLIQLHLSGNQLTGPIPGELGRLTKLIYADLNGNPDLCNPPEAARWSIADDLARIPVCETTTTVTRQTTGLEADSLALVGLYNATGGPNWTNDENWLTGPVSSWHGVTVEQGRVTTLDLSINQLSGALPPALGQLTSLHYLYLYENQLTGPIPPELGGLTDLWALWLNDNQLTGSIPAELGGLTELQALVLTDNQLTGSIPAELGQMTSLMGLHLAENGFTGAIPPELGRLTNLNDLRLYDNRLTGNIPPQLGQLRKLERLYLGSNQLTGTVPLELGNMRNILDMDLSDNPDLCKSPQADRWWTGSHLQTVAVCQYTGLAADSLALVALYNATDGPNWTNNTNWLAGPVSSWHGVTVEQNRVVNLGLNQNQLTGTIPAELGQLSMVKELYLGGNTLTGGIPPELSQLRMLEWLDLCGNQLTGAIPAQLGALNNLTHLDLCTNQLTGPLPVELNLLPKLRQLTLHSNPGLCKPPRASEWTIADKISDIADCETTGVEDREKNPRDTATDGSTSLTLEDLVGTYERQPVESFIYTGTLVQQGDRMHWTFGWDPNDGKGFDLIPDLDNLRLIPDENAMAYYINRGPRQFSLIVTDGQVEGFTYNEIKYTKRGFLKAKTGVRFVDNGDGTVTDNLSGLIWLKDANCADLVPPDHFEDHFAFTRDDALQAAAELQDGMCGLSDGSKPGDWRLPTVAEFCGGWTNQPVGFCVEEGGLVDPTAKNPALSNAQGDAPWTEGDVFTNVYYGDEKGYHTSTPSIPPDPGKEAPYGNEHVWRVFLSWQGKWGGNGAWTLSFFPDARVWPVRTASRP